jgi:hypothetical protein
MDATREQVINQLTHAIASTASTTGAPLAHQPTALHVVLIATAILYALELAGASVERILRRVARIIRAGWEVRNVCDAPVATPVTEDLGPEPTTKRPAWSERARQLVARAKQRWQAPR